VSENSPSEAQVTAGHNGAEAPEVETGLIIPVPAFEQFIQHHRAINPAVSPEGVPAHLTLLYPFLPPQGCAESHAEVSAFFASVEPIEFELSEIGWFDDRVVFVAPDDPAPFVALTERLIAEWTECIPYGGRHGGKHVPHLTLGIEGTPEEMSSLAEAARQLLPMKCVADQAWLMIGTSHPARWDVSDRFAFGSGSESSVAPAQRFDEP
jgi:2'-5' RNA ligase